jgi:Zn-finger nucleic acid-binding protein
MPFGVLEELISHSEELWEEPEEVQKVKEETVAEGRRICPEDGAVLRAIPYRDDAKVRVDECPTCYGILLDAGELAKIGDDTEGIFANLRDEVRDDATALEVFLGKILPFLPK